MYGILFCLGFIDGITLLIMTLYTDALNTNVEGRMVLMMYIIFTIASSQVKLLLLSMVSAVYKCDGASSFFSVLLGVLLWDT